MTAFIKKQGPAFYFNILSAAAGIAAFIAMVISSTMNEAYALNSFPLFVLGAIAGILLILIAVYAANRWGNYDYVGTLSGVAAVARANTEQTYDLLDPASHEPRPADIRIIFLELR